MTVAPPKTVLHAAPEEEAAIRQAVRTVDPTTLSKHHVHAELGHVRSLVMMLSDPEVSSPLYDLPRPLTDTAMAAWVLEAQIQAHSGEGLLLVTLDARGQVNSYFRFRVWPERASGEVAGALRADLQGRRAGGSGIVGGLGWMFEALGLRLVAITAALDNVRSVRVVEAAGFKPMGLRDCLRRDGTLRSSFYWELTRDEWRRQQFRRRLESRTATAR